MSEEDSKPVDEVKEQVVLEDSAVPTKSVPDLPPVSKVVAGVVLLVVALLIVGLMLVLRDRNQLKQEVSKLSQSQTVGADEAKQLSAEVGKLIELPSDEIPTVATVVAAEKVKNQAFFTNAQNGDKVLLYAKSSKAVLYRPSTKKIIEVAPINIGNNQTTGTQ